MLRLINNKPVILRQTLVSCITITATMEIPDSNQYSSSSFSPVEISSSVTEPELGELVSVDTYKREVAS